MKKKDNKDKNKHNKKVKFFIIAFSIIIFFELIYIGFKMIPVKIVLNGEKTLNLKQVVNIQILVLRLCF